MKAIQSAASKSRPGSSFWANIFKRRSNEDKSILTILRKVPLFATMSDGEMREFERLIHRRQFKAGETIFWEGEPGVGMYIIQQGVVSIVKHYPGKEREALVLLHEGEFFGELALLDESPRSASAIAQESAKILGLFRPDLFDLLERKPRVGNKFLFQLALVVGERLKNSNAEMQELRTQIEQANIIA